MNEFIQRLKLRYRSAKERASDAEIAVQDASKCRLAELLKLQPRERLANIEDDLLIPADRSKLTASIAGNINHQKRDFLIFGARLLFRRSRRWLRILPVAVASSAIVFLLGMPVYTAWNNTDEIIVLPRAINFNWTLPNGAFEQKLMPLDARLAISRRSGKPAIARRWIKGEGYATTEIPVR